MRLERIARMLIGAGIAVWGLSHVLAGLAVSTPWVSEERVDQIARYEAEDAVYRHFMEDH